MPDAWSVVLGDYDRHIESGHEQRIAIDRIVMHDNYENYQHDVVLMRLAGPANMQHDALVRKICLPFLATSSGSGSFEEQQPDNNEESYPFDAFDGGSNQLRKLQITRNAGQQQQMRRRNDKFIKERSVFNRDDDRTTYVAHFNQLHAVEKDKLSSTAPQQQHHHQFHKTRTKVNVSTNK